ncbi:protein bicaudal C homolog 1 [Hyalella azteca]|uniref:Protein bicaudal C homolog 1 n=1 Tax=Hyalella azteca TaxID=294128 RepID=A0A8B7PG23_HYAAZ|nr:protein bicaudal C homolog 1 [Hyalella azteca]
MEKKPPRIVVSHEEKPSMSMRNQTFASRMSAMGENSLSRLPHSTRLLSVDEVMSLMTNAEKQASGPRFHTSDYGGFRQHRIASADGDLNSQAIMDENSDLTSEGTLSRCTSTDRISLADGQVEERFRVDRRKLEAMILGCPPDPCDFEIMRLPIGSDGRILSADDFFARVMATTDTDIRYPKLLKVGARNRKDPHIRVVGTPENVSIASMMVRQQLEPHNKITMKMDVSWTHHSHIIGKAGNTIQPVVRRTGVSIHFPDGNKNNETRKSNQVSINSRGEELGGLEDARASIRQLTPLVFSFSFKANADFIAISEPNALVQHVQGLFNVQVELCVTVDVDPQIVGSVRGSETDVTRVKEATLTLLQTLCGPIASHLNVQMKVEVSPQHHSFVLGRNNETLRRIMQSTGTTICFPDSNDTDLPPLQRSSVVISGAIDNVYAARQNIIGALPLVLMFEVASDAVTPDEMAQVMQSFNLVIVPKAPRPDGRRPVVIKGAEKDAAHIYEAWKLVTRSDKRLPSVRIPPSYHISHTALPHTTLGRPGMWGGVPPPLSRTSSGPMTPFPFPTNLPSPLSPAFPPATPGFPSSPSFNLPSTSPLLGALMRGGHSPLWPPSQSMSTRFPFPAPRSGQFYHAEGTSNFYANVAALSNLSSNSPSYMAHDNNVFGVNNSAQYGAGYGFPTGDHLNNNYLSLNNNYYGNRSAFPMAANPVNSSADDGNVHSYDNVQSRQQLQLLQQQQQQQQQQHAAQGRPDESASGGSCSSSCGVVSPSTSSPQESSPRDSSPEMVVLGHIQSPPGMTKFAPPQPTSGGASPALKTSSAAPASSAAQGAQANFNTSDSATRSRDLSSLLSEFQDRRAPGCEKELQQAMHKLSVSDYEAKQILANKAMREPVGGTVRVPTSNWSGYGFSKSSPSYPLRQQFQQAGLLKKTVDRTSAATQSPTGAAQDMTGAAVSADWTASKAQAHFTSDAVASSAQFLQYERLMATTEAQRMTEPSSLPQVEAPCAMTAGAPVEEDEWLSAAGKWSGNDGSGATVASAVDSGIAASISSSNQASLTLSDPESSDGIGHSAASSFGSVGAAALHSDHQIHQLGTRFSASNLHEFTSGAGRFWTTRRAAHSSQLELPALLESMSLSQYIDVFNSHEVDLRTFLTLNDDELKELGIGVFGHRKRLLFAIKNFTSFLPELSSAEGDADQQRHQQHQAGTKRSPPHDAAPKTVTWNC